MGKLKINYVKRLPRGAEELAPDVVELRIRVSGRKVDVNIVRRGSSSPSRSCTLSETGLNASRSRPRMSTNRCQNELAFLPNSALTGANTSMISYKTVIPGRF
jgi:hypothetical protein